MHLSGAQQFKFLKNVYKTISQNVIYIFLNKRICTLVLSFKTHLFLISKEIF